MRLFLHCLRHGGTAPFLHQLITNREFADATFDVVLILPQGKTTALTWIWGWLDFFQGGISCANRQQAQEQWH
jgi:hypothetical protein